MGSAKKPMSFISPKPTPARIATMPMSMGSDNNILQNENLQADLMFLTIATAKPYLVFEDISSLTMNAVG